LNLNQFQCKNNRCIDKTLICDDEDYCGDNSQMNSLERNTQCPLSINLFLLNNFNKSISCFLELSKEKMINWRFALLLTSFLFVFILICILIICRKRRRNKERVGEL
jgi:hypothetical protein